METLLKIIEALILATALMTNAGATLTMTEIMFNPTGTDTHREWIEVYNTGPGEVNITGWKLFEENTSHTLTAVESQPSPNNDSILMPGEYAVIAESPQQFLLEYPAFRETLIDTYWSSLANTGETIGLKNQDNELTETLAYSPTWGADGNDRTLEKRDMTGGNSRENWGESMAQGGTPGRENSITQAQSTTSTTSTTSSMQATTSTSSSIASMQTTTTSTTTQEELTTTSSSSSDASMQTSTSSIADSSSSIEPSSTSTSTSQSSTTTSTTTELGTTTSTSNSSTTNSTTSTTNSTTTNSTTMSTTSKTTTMTSMQTTTRQTTTTTQATSIAISEIMFNPEPWPDSQYEFIELYNYGNLPIDLNDWLLSDNGSDIESLKGFRNTVTVIQPNGYAVVTDEYSLVQVSQNAIHLSTGDSSICTSGLSNTGESIKLFTPDGTEVDALEYSSTWGGNGNGNSLEKITLTGENERYNWGESQVEGGSTGDVNTAEAVEESTTTNRQATEATSRVTSKKTTTSLPKCSDGTREGKCARKKPNYCQDGVLVSRCSTCGCNKYYECIDEECVKIDENSQTEDETITTTTLKSIKRQNSTTQPEEVNQEEPQEEETPQEKQENILESGITGQTILTDATQPKAMATIGASVLLGVYLLHKKRKQEKEKTPEIQII